MFTWSVVAARVGFNFRATEDGRTVIRGSYGRAYRQIFTGEFSNVHPGLSPITLARWNPATASYSTIISVTDPIANVRVDPDIEAPHTDSYSIGLDRELMTNLGVSVSYAHKYGQKHVGWTDIGGIYTPTTAVLENGQSLVVQSLANSPSARVYLRTNGPGYFNRYNGLLLSLNKRMSQRWSANVAYTLSKAKGLVPGPIPTGGTAGNLGQDPNDFINAVGLLSTDRPHVFTVAATYLVPRVDVQLTPNFIRPL
jgi:hypothetical protein